MQPQDVALHSSPNRRFEALESQPKQFDANAYLFHRLSTKFSHDCTQAIITSIKGQARRGASWLPVTRDRRNRCQRASRASSLSALRPLWRRVLAQQKKILLLSIRNPFRPSQYILANISKTNIGQAFGPALSRQTAIVPLTTRGTPC